MARLILDTGVIVAAVRGHLDMPLLGDTDDVAVPAIVVAEYLAGTLLDPLPARRAAQREFLQDLLGVVPVRDYDGEVAEHHAALLAHVRRTGTLRGARDLIVAATARASDRILLTTGGRAGFDELPEVRTRLVDARG